VNKESSHAELNKKKWDRRSETYDEKRFNYFRFMQKRVFSFMHLKECQHFLDIGCGTGWAVRCAANLVKEGGEAYGIDIAPRMIEKARENANGLKNVHFLQADAENLPFEDNFFDAIICTNSFHHYLHPLKVLTEVHRVLKPGGRIHILDLTSDGFLGRMIDRQYRKREREHVKYYSSREYRDFFNKSKLSYISSKLIVPIIMAMKLHIAEKSTK
jgi:ubiquinone/menaquinone biosynthesis C-methylase UbiE